MRYVFVFLLTVFSSAFAINIDNWQNLRFSENTSSGNVYFRADIPQSDINFNKLLYSTGTTLSEMDFPLLRPGTYQALVASGSGRTYYGLRKQAGSGPMEVLPLRYTGTSLPAPGLLTKVSDAPSYDQATNYLDIIADYVTVSDTKLIVGLQTRGGGFPPGSFFGPWNSYMIGLASPELDDPYAPGAVAWAFHYVSVPFLMSTGLYKITGTGISDVNRIGDISTSIDTATNTLVMSCDISTLLADPDFTAWYDVANPKFALLSLINRISGTTVTQMDSSPGGYVYPVPLYVDAQTTPVGQISELSLNMEPLDLYFSTTYHKAADRFNWDLNYRTEDGRVYPMHSSDPEHSEQRYYRSANLFHVFPEVDDELGRVWVERVPGVYQQSDWLSYSFVRGVNEPSNLHMEVVADQLLLAWDPVVQTPDGAVIEVDYYTVDHSDDPSTGFTAFSQTESTSLTIPLSTIGDKVFFRIKGHKIIP